METTISKEVKFDCAHMLSGHKGKCANLHGHTYTVQVLLTGEPISGGSSDHMVMDFGDLKKVLEEHIVNVFDHAVIFSGAKYRGPEENELFDWAARNKMRLFVMPKRTTAECMAEYFATTIKRHTGAPRVSVAVWETPTSYAEVAV